MASRTTNLTKGKRLRTLEWDAQLERAGEAFYTTLARLARAPESRSAYRRFARLERANALAIRQELLREGGRLRGNTPLLLAGVAAAAAAPLMPRKVFHTVAARVQGASDAFLRTRRRAYGAGRAELLARLRAAHAEQQAWFEARLRG